MRTPKLDSRDTSPFLAVLGIVIALFLIAVLFSRLYQEKKGNPNREGQVVRRGIDY